MPYNYNDIPAVSVDDLIDSLLPGQSDALEALFRSQGASKPMVFWSPQTERYRTDRLRRFGEVCDTLSGRDGLMRADDFSIDAFGSLADWMIVVEAEGTTYRYRHYGRQMIEHSGTNRLGRFVDELPPHLSVFLKALYQACAFRRERVLSKHNTPRTRFDSVWRRLMVPIVENDGSIRRLVSLADPDNILLAGLELVPEPFFIIDPTGYIHFANTAARKHFKLTRPGAARTNITAISCLSLDDLPDPKQMAASGGELELVDFTNRGPLLERMLVRISAIEDRHNPYYCILMRPTED